MIVTDWAMSAAYSNYIAAHQDFADYQARKRIMTVRGIDFSNVEAFTYDALVDLIGTSEPNQEELAHLISQEIGEIQNAREDLINYVRQGIDGRRAAEDRMIQADTLMDKCVSVATKLLETFSRLPTNFTSGDTIRVEAVANNILNWEADLRAAAQRLALRQGPQLVKVVPTSNNSREDTTVSNLRGLYSALLGNIQGSLGKGYESLLAFLVGEMGSEVYSTLITQLGNTWDTGGVQFRPSARGDIAVSQDFSEFNFHGKPTAPLTKRASGTLIDWYVDGQDLSAGFNIRLPVSQKIYWDPNKTGELNIKAISSRINSKVLQVASSIPEAYALYRAFASPSSRGPKGHEKHIYSQTKSLAEAIVKHTFFDDAFGSNFDSVSDILINRVLYSAEAVINKLLDSDYITKGGKQRFNIEIESKGTESSNNPEVDAARKSEVGAAGVWVSNARLQRIKTASFIVHWYFETAWFNDVVTRF